MEGISFDDAFWIVVIVQRGSASKVKVTEYDLGFTNRNAGIPDADFRGFVGSLKFHTEYSLLPIYIPH